MSQKIENQIVFSNEVINKRKLQGLMYLTFNNYGIVKSSIIADQIKNLTFYYATKSGISLSVEDLRVPFNTMIPALTDSGCRGSMSLMMEYIHTYVY